MKKFFHKSTKVTNYGDKYYAKSNIRWVGYGIILLGIFLISFLTYLSGILNQGNESFRPFRYVISESMEPNIRKGSVIQMRKYTTEDTLKAQDIVIFKVDSEMFIHRIIEIRQDEAGKNYYITKGDNNETTDMFPNLYDENVVGIFEKEYYELGYFKRFMDFVPKSAMILVFCTSFIVGIILTLPLDRYYIKLYQKKIIKNHKKLLKEQIKIDNAISSSKKLLKKVV